MKVTKRIASLFLALMMALSVMAVTAAAYGEETHVHSDECIEESVIARKPGNYCPNCMAPALCHEAGQDGAGLTIYIYECPNCGRVEKHV